MTNTRLELEALLRECANHEIRLSCNGDGELIVDGPKDALTPNFLTRLKNRKPELLGLMEEDAVKRRVHSPDAEAVWRATLDQLDAEQTFPPEVLDALRKAEVAWAGDLPDASPPLDADGWPANSVDPDELTPCPKCGSLELWQSVAGDLFGLTPGRWRCVHCDPPVVADQLREHTERIRKSMAKPTGNKPA